MLNLLTVEYETEDVLLNRFEDYVDGSTAFLENPTAFSIASPQIYTLCKQRSISDRLESALKCGSNDSQHFWCLLGQTSIDDDCRVAISQKGPERLMRLVAQKLPKACLPERSKEHAEGWRELLPEAVQLVAQAETFRMSPLYTRLLREIWRPRNAQFEVRSIQDAAYVWLRELELAGQDLLRYGELEQTAFIQRKSLNMDIRFECCYLSWYPMLINFSFGPQIEDWRFFISWPLDEWAGE